MESRRGFGPRGALLPYEIAICENIGITPDEYLEFFAAAYEYVEERKKEYELVPDITNEAVSLSTVLVNLVIGLSLTAVGLLLAPKPRQINQDRQANLDIPSETGRTRYTKNSNFDSVQQLATLGRIIPLVFAEYQQGKNVGGVRVDTDLLHSQLLSSGNSQVFTGIFNISLAELGRKPDFDGYALGDLLLRDLARYKMQLYFSNKGSQNRIVASDQYDRSKLELSSDEKIASDRFAVNISKRSYAPYFSGTRTPTTRTQFGGYSPMPNYHVFYAPYELTMVQKGIGKPSRDAQKAKREKITKPFPRCCGVTKIEGKIITYTIQGNNAEGKVLTKNFESYKDGGETKYPYDFFDWGLNDINSTINETRQSADETIQLTEQYLIGETLAVCTQRPEKIWIKERTIAAKYEFRFTDLDNSIRLIPPENRNGKLDAVDFDNGMAFLPWTGPAIMRAAIASVANNRPCDITEIGIKSEVWRQMTNSANFQQHPNMKTIEGYEEKQKDGGGGQINLGSKTSYMSRWSFFQLEARPIGPERNPEKEWKKAADRPFGVLGNTPVFQYNTIAITHPEENSLYEYRFVPVPGARFYNLGTSADIYHLTGRDLNKGSETTPFNGYKIRFTGEAKSLSVSDRENDEWVFGGEYTPDELGPIVDLADYSKDFTGNGIPTEIVRINKQGPFYSETPGEQTVVIIGPAANQQAWYWGGQLLGTTTKDGQEFLTTTTNDRIYRYRRENIIKQRVEPEWVPAPAGVRLDSVIALNPSTDQLGFLPINGVVTNASGRYDYYWGGNLVVANQPNKDWFKYESATVRYRTQPGVDPVQPARTIFEPDPDLENLYAFSVKNNRFIHGAELVRLSQPDQYGQTYKFVFYYNEKEVGETKVEGRSFCVTDDPAEGRWYLDNLIQVEQPSTFKAIGSFRDINFADPNATANQSVTNGAYRNIDGQYVYKYQGVVVARAFSTLPVFNTAGTLQFERDTSVMPVPIGLGALPCWPIKVAEKTSGKSERWSISFRYKIESPEICGIRRFALAPGQNGTARISREREKEQEVKPINPDGEVFNIIPVTPNRIPPVVLEYAKARVYLYYAPGSASPDYARWTLDYPGLDYIAGEEVSIGPREGLGILTRVETVNLPGGGINTDPSYSEFIEEGRNYFPANAICDYFINNTDRTSHQNGPEHELAFINEITPPIKPTGPQFQDLAIAGVKITNSKEWSNLSNLSVYVSRGIKIERLYERRTWIPGEDGATGTWQVIAAGTRETSNLFPEIAYALLTDDLIGAGELIGAESVDRESMAIAAQFCEANGFYWDGVISQTQNLREFIFEQAAYCMLDFTIKGGKFSLYPSVLFNKTDFTIVAEKPQIKALFGDGNMRNMTVSFLEPEERQRFQASVLYRIEQKNNFPVTATKIVRLTAGSSADPIEQFDLTQFCTSAKHAELFAMYALANRVHITHGIKFETTPTAAANLEPGDYIRIATTVTHIAPSRSGSIDNDGYIQSSSQIGSGSIPVIYWKPGTASVQTTTLSFSADRSGVPKTSQANLFGALWCEEVTTAQKIIYKIETISFADDGLVEVSASEAPTEEDGTLKTVDWIRNETNERYQVIA